MNLRNLLRCTRKFSHSFHRAVLAIR